MRICG
jgi:hypothetical protein